MPGLLQYPEQCCGSCEDPVVTEIPGPSGSNGAAGAAGTNGVNAYSTVSSYSPSSQPVVPAELANVTLNVSSSLWMAASQILYIEGRGFFQVVSKPSSTSVIITNLENTATGAYASNSPPGTSFTALIGISPGGIQGTATITGPNLYSGSGTPEAVVTADVGSIYTDTATGNIWKKISGSGNTGWV